MNRFTYVVLLLLLNLSLHANTPYYPDNNWIAKEPSSMGWDSAKLAKAKEQFIQSGARAMMIIDDGYIIAQWGETKRKVNVHSVRKSLLSALYGIYYDQGKVDLCQNLATLGMDDKEGLSPSEKEATIQDLLKARSGIYHPAAYETKSMRKNRPKRGSHVADTYFFYNNWDFNALGAIFEKHIAHKSIYEAFYHDIAKPTGMNFTIEDGKYVYHKSSLYPAYSFYLSNEDRARFGLLYLRGGKWQDKQIISEKWMQKSLTSYSENRSKVGYGYLWWVTSRSKHFGIRDKKAFSARGNWGQYIFVSPKHNLVIAHTSDRKGGDPKISKGQFKKLLKMIMEAKSSKTSSTHHDRFMQLKNEHKNQ
jgi:CubicO group peptidase (beta-lactamase class C family)